jgi:hypothetical protein
MKKDLQPQEVLENVTRTKKRKGKVTGVWATTSINRGVRIFAEKPLISFKNGEFNEDSLVKAFLNLSTEDQENFMKLRVNKKREDDPNDIMKIFEHNFFFYADGSKHLFPKLAHFEHQCAPSAIVDWNVYIGRMTVHMLRTVEEGEEITISYINTLASFQERWLSLRGDFGINCLCKMCRPETPFGIEMHNNMTRLLEIDGLIKEFEEDPAAWSEEHGKMNPLQFVKEFIGLVSQF